nr:hypothetical protein Ade03nite_72610 [Actinoplanes derwentensis]
MGRVWAAHDELLARDVAIKELVPPAGLIEPELQALRQRAIREARAIAALDHPNVVRLHDVIFDGGNPWIVMELVPSRSLFDALRADGPMAPDEVARVGLGVLAALMAAHRAGLLHRDVKPGNVLLAHDGRVVLTDFGLATAAGDAAMTSTGVILGSPQYIAPERALDGEIGPAADLWSLGATLYAAVEGRPPYVRSSPVATLAALATELPDPPERAGVLRHALTALLQRDPARRADAETAQSLLLAATVPGSPPPADVPPYTEPTFAILRRPVGTQPGSPAVAVDLAALLSGTSTPNPATTDAPAALSVPVPVTASTPVTTDVVVALEGPAPADAAQTVVAPIDPAGPPPGGTEPATRELPQPERPRARRLSVLAGLQAAALLLMAGFIAYPLMNDDPDRQQPQAAWTASTPGVADSAGTPRPATTKSRPLRPSATAAPGVSPTGSAASSGATKKPSTKPSTKPSSKPATATTTTEAPPTASGSPFRSIGTGTCLQASGTSGRIQLWTCNDAVGQRFTHPADGTLRVRGKCVQIGSTDNGSALSLATCTGAVAQQWDYNTSSDLVSLWAYKCVDVTEASTADGALAQIWDCTGAAHQKWTY